MTNNDITYNSRPHFTLLKLGHFAYWYGTHLDPNPNPNPNPNTNTNPNTNPNPNKTSRYRFSKNQVFPKKKIFSCNLKTTILPPTSTFPVLQLDFKSN